MGKRRPKGSEVKETESFFHFHRSWLGKEEEREVLETLRSGWLTTGPRTHEFERGFAEYIGCKHAIGLNSCTAGLHLGLVVLGVGAGDEVITTPMTFPATSNVIVHQGAKPVFVDIEPESLNMNARLIENHISHRTKAILPVHLFGRACEMETILEVARKHQLAVIEDAAHAIETEIKGKKVGTLGDLTAFSFYATKNITTGEGGMLTTNRDDLAEKIRVLSLHGITTDAWERHGGEEFVHWDVVVPGYKYNMFDIQGALGIHQLKRIEGFWRRRKQLVEIYDHELKDLPEIQLLTSRQGDKPASHLYVIVVKTEKLTAHRDTLLQELRRASIGAGVHFRSLHLTSFYSKNFGFKRGDFPNAEYASDRVVSLPLYPKMEVKDVHRVVQVLKSILQRYSKSKSV